MMSTDTTTLAEKQAYLQEMMAKRGYILENHKVLVAEDLPFMKGINQLVAAAYTNERNLSKQTKELVFAAVMTAVGAPKDLIKLHIDLAAKAGATKAEVLEALEITVLPSGLPKFFAGLEAWTESFEAERIEP